MTFPENKQLEADARMAVLVRRSDLPVPLQHPALSYFGGLPKLPPEFEWPQAEVTADEDEETVALTFVAQIDLTELPPFERRSLLPEKGTLYFFCSSVFEGEGEPPCQVLFYPGSAAEFPQRETPPDLMPLAGAGGDYQVKWLEKGSDFQSCVEFKYPLSFLMFKDFGHPDDPDSAELLISSLCEVLGPGEPLNPTLRQYRSASDFADDADWPFNWSLITHVARSVVCHVKDDSEPYAPEEQLSDEVRQRLHGILTSANEWLNCALAHPPFDSVTGAEKEAFRAWWMSVVSQYQEMQKEVSTYAHQFPEDLDNAIKHNIRLLATQDEEALTQAPQKYVETLKNLNHWTTPQITNGRYSTACMTIHQMLGYGESVQGAPAEHLDDVLLLQLKGDDAFLPWHNNCGCVLQIWIDREDLRRCDFAGAEATLECD